MTTRGAAVLVLVVLLAALAAVLAIRVPWRRPEAPRDDQLAALRALPADRVERARAHVAALRPATYGSPLVALVVILVLGFTSLGARLVAAVGGDSFYGRAVGGGLVVILLTSLVTMPFGAWRHVVQRRFDLSTQGWGGWAMDELKGYLITIVLAGLVLAGFFGLTRLAPRTWWVWAAAALSALVVLLSFVLPVVVEPMFNRFTPMPDGEARTRLLDLAARDSVPVRDVLVADASRRTRAVNAYVSGMGATRRIVVYDTLLREADAAEVEGVVAHELGHAKDGDVVTGTAFAALSAAVAAVAGYLIGSWTGLLHRAGVGSITDPRAIPLMLALATLAGLILGPAGNVLSRRMEARADTHAMDLTGDPATFERMQSRLATVNLSDPDPNRFEYAMFASHPSTVQRMAAAMAYGRGRLAQ